MDVEVVLIRFQGFYGEKRVFCGFHYLPVTADFDIDVREGVAHQHDIHAVAPCGCMQQFVLFVHRIIRAFVFACPDVLVKTKRHVIVESERKDIFQRLPWSHTERGGDVFPFVYLVYDDSLCVEEHVTRIGGAG